MPLRLHGSMHEDPSFIVLRGSERDPDSKKRGAAIRAHFEYERMRGIREVLVYLVAGLSVCVWPLAAWPQLGGFFRRLGLAGWICSFAGLVATAVQEAYRFRVRARLIAELHDEPKVDP